MKSSDSKQSLDVFDASLKRKQKTRLVGASEMGDKASDSTTPDMGMLGKSHKKKQTGTVVFAPNNNPTSGVQTPYISPQPTGFGGPAFSQ